MAAVEGAAVPEGPPTLADRVNFLPLELRSTILHSLARSLPPAAARTFASMGSAALQAVLEARAGLHCFRGDTALAPLISRLRFSPCSEFTSRAQLRCSYGEWVIRVSLPLALACVIAEQQHAEQMPLSSGCLLQRLPMQSKCTPRVDPSTNSLHGARSHCRLE